MTSSRTRRRTDPSRREPIQARALHSIGLILQAAAQIALRDGEAGFNTNRIAERAGVSIGTLYQYFPDKAAILDRLMADWGEAAVAAVDQALIDVAAAGGSFDEATAGVVREVLHRFGGQTPDERRMARLMWRADQAERIPRAVRDAAQRMGLRLQHWAAAPGVVASVDNVYLATRAVLGAVRFASIETSPVLDSPDFERGLQRLARAVLRPADNPTPCD